MTLPGKKGREEMNDAQPHAIGDYVQRVAGGRYIVLRGKFKGGYLDTIPRGYVRNFLLKTCREDMTPLEIELCEAYAGEETIRIKRTLRMKEKAVVEVSGKGIAEAFERAAEHGCTEISLTIPVPDTFKQPTVIDRLRTRGTPLELIGSYIVAEDYEGANAAFRTCVLETLYERIRDLIPGQVTVQFLLGTTCATHEGKQHYPLSKNPMDLKQIALALVPEHEDQVGIFEKPEDVLRVPVATIITPPVASAVVDSLHSSIVSNIIALTEAVLKNVQDAITRMYGKYGEEGVYKFAILPDQSTATITKQGANAIAGQARIALFGYCMQKPA